MRTERFIRRCKACPLDAGPQIPSLGATKRRVECNNPPPQTINLVRLQAENLHVRFGLNRIARSPEQFRASK
jgi:hypothetical protein